VAPSELDTTGFAHRAPPACPTDWPRSSAVAAMRGATARRVACWRACGRAQLLPRYRRRGIDGEQGAVCRAP
jgi:hypothetical protein